MIHGTSTDVSFLLKMLPPYLFPNDERIVSLFAVTGKSLGGHAAWQVLAHEPIIRVGVPFIGTPDFQKLLAQRTKASDLPDAPPQVPLSLRSVIQRIDPARAPYNRPDPSNPFFGKKICSCSGEDDHLVRWSFSEEFLKSLVVAPPGSEEANRSLEIFLQPNTGHKVTPESKYVVLTQCCDSVDVGWPSGRLHTNVEGVGAPSSFYSDHTCTGTEAPNSGCNACHPVFSYTSRSKAGTLDFRLCRFSCALSSFVSAALCCGRAPFLPLTLPRRVSRKHWMAPSCRRKGHYPPSQNGRPRLPL